MFNHYFIHRIRNNQTMETDFYGFTDEVKYSWIDKCLLTADCEGTKVFNHITTFLWHYEEKYDCDGDTVTVTIDINGDIISVKATYPNEREHEAIAVAYID